MLEYALYLTTFTAILSLAILGIQIQLGRIGLLNLGHVAFFGMGAYTFIYLCNLGQPLLVCLLAGLLLGAVTGTALMALGNSLSPATFSLASFGFLEAIHALTIYFKGITNGAGGLILLHQPDVSVGSKFWIYLFISLILFYGLIDYLTKPKIGLIWQGIKEREALTQSLGFSTYTHKLFTAAMAGGCSGLGGAFLAGYVSYVDPAIFSVTYLIQQLTMAIVGGIGSVWNTIFGVFSLTGITEGLRFLPIPSSYLGPLHQLFYAILLLGILALGAVLTFNQTKE